MNIAIVSSEANRFHTIDIPVEFSLPELSLPAEMLVRHYGWPVLESVIVDCLITSPIGLKARSFRTRVSTAIIDSIRLAAHGQEAETPTCVNNQPPIWQKFAAR